MISLFFQGTYPYTGHAVRVPVRLRDSKTPYVIMAILDTGATYSVFSKSHAGPLGIADITTGSEPLILTVANGATDTAYIHTITLECFGRIYRAPVAFCPTWPDDVPNLLGMRGFFSEFVVAFDHKRKRIFHG